MYCGAASGKRRASLAGAGGARARRLHASTSDGRDSRR